MADANGGELTNTAARLAGRMMDNVRYRCVVNSMRRDENEWRRECERECEVEQEQRVKVGDGRDFCACTGGSAKVTARALALSARVSERVGLGFGFPVRIR